MATYRIQGPDGKNYAFDAPPGLSPQQIDIIKGGLFQQPEPEPVAPPAPKAETGFIPSVMRGGRGIYSLLGDVAPAMLGKLVGAEDYAKRQMQEAAEYQKETQRLYPAEVASFTDIKDVGSALTYIKEAIGEAIPSIIPAVFTGGLASVASRGAVAAAEKAAQGAAARYATEQLVRKGGEAALTQEALQGVKAGALKAGEEAARRVALQYQVGGTLAGSAAQNVPEVYQNIYEKGEAGQLPDLAPAIVAGGFNAVLDAILPIQLLRKTKLSGIPDEQIIGAWYKRAAVGGAKGFLTEGGTEAVQEMSSAAAEAFVNQNAKFFTPENFVRFIDAGLKGGFGGAAISGVSDVLLGRAEEKVPTGVEPGAADALAKTLGEGETSVTEPQPTTGGGGFEIFEQPAEPAPAQGVAGVEQPGVVPAEPDVGAVVGGEGAKPSAVEPAPAPAAPALPAPTPETKEAAPAPIPEGYKPYSEWMAERKKAMPPAPEPEPYVPPTTKEVEERRKKIKKEIAQDEAVIGKFYDQERMTSRFEDEASKSLYEATEKGELPADQQPGMRRFDETLLKNGLVPDLYELPENFNEFTSAQKAEYKQGIARDIHAELKDLYGKRAELPEWNKMTRDGKDVFLANMTENTPEERTRARMHLRDYLNRVAQVQGTTRTKTTAAPEARIYETNRATYNKFEDVDFPLWNELTDDQRKLFTTSLRKYSPKEKTERGTSVQHDFAFKSLGNVLKEERDRVESEKKKKTVPPRYEEAQKEIEEKQKKAEQPEKVEPIAKTTPEKPFGEGLAEEEAQATEKTIEKAAKEKTEKRAAATKALREAIEQNDIKRVLNFINANSKNPVHRIVAQRILQGAAGLKTKISFADKLPDGHVAQYDPKTDEIKVTEDGFNNTTLLHEVVHAVTVRAIYKYYSDKKSLTDAERDAVEQLLDVMAVAKQEIGDFNPSAFKDLYEFVSYAMSDTNFQRELSRVKSKNLEYSELPQKFSLWTDFMKAVANLFPSIMRMFDKKGKLKEDEANLLAETFNAFEQIMSVPEGGVEMAPFPATMVLPAGQAPSEMTQEAFIQKALDSVRLKEQGGKAFLQHLMSTHGYNWIVTKFQNERRAVKLASDRAELFGILNRIGENINDVYGQITRSTGMAVHLYQTEMHNLEQAVHDAIDAYAEARGVTLKEALPELHLILEARHEPERRLVKFLLRVPLDNDKKYKVKGFEGARSAEGWREFILEQLTRTDIKKEEVKQLRGLLEDFALDPKGRFYSRTIFKTDKNGKTTTTIIDDEAAKNVYNPNSELYNVIGSRSAADIARITKALDTDALKKEIDAVSKTIQAVHEETIRLNKESNYWSAPVQNVKDFYGYKNYVPFKGRPKDKIDEELSLDSRRLGGELQDLAVGFEGRLSESENPLLQSLAEGAQAAMRAGRRDLTGAIKNAIKDGIIKGDKKPVATISFADRYLRGADREKIGGADKIFHYLPDGTIEIWKINDKAQLEAIRRSYRTAQPLIDIANSITSAIGQGHTRYNPAFAPMNFVRDSLTNAFLLGAELGPKKSAQLINGIAAEVATGGIYRSMNFARLYANGKFDEIRQLAGGNASVDTLNSTQKYYRDLLEYVELGGKVSYLQGVAAKGALDGLMKEVGRSGVMKTKDQVDKFFDIYNDMFELAARVGAYRMLRDDFTRNAKNQKERDEAQVRAVEITKNLANFEQVGQWGKAAGAAFMFFRPAATGAVRAIDALRPMFGFNEADFRAEAKAEGRTEEQIETAIEKLRQKTKDARHMAAALAGAGAVMYLAAMMLSDDDEAGRNRVATDDMARWTRYARFFIPGFEKPVQIPWAFGPGAFAAAGAQVASLASGRVRLGDAMTNIMTIGLDSFLPLPFSRISPIDNFPAFAVDSVTPSALRPFFEYVMNLDGLGREIYNNRQSRYGDAYTGGDSIPEIYKAVARSLFNATNGKVDWSPNTLYFFASNYIDGAAKMTSSGYNMGLTLMGQKDFDPKTDALFFSSFIGSKSNYDAREFSRAENYIKGLDKRINSLKDKPEMFREYAKENPEDLALVQAYNAQVNGGLRMLREAANKVRVDKTLTVGERKAQLEQIVNLQNTVKRNMLLMFESINGHPI